MPHTNREVRAEEFRKTKREARQSTFNAWSAGGGRGSGGRGGEKRGGGGGGGGGGGAKGKSVKNNMRSLQRSLNRLASDDPKRDDIEAKLAMLREKGDQNRQSAKEQALAIRYHKVKFFERLKAVKHLNRVEKDLANANPESDKQRLESDLKKAREDLIYVKFFPKDAKYVSLYGRRSGADKIDEKGRAQQDKYRAEALKEALSLGDLATVAEAAKFNTSGILNVTHVKQREILEDDELAEQFTDKDSEGGPEKEEPNHRSSSQREVLPHKSGKADSSAKARAASRAKLQGNMDIDAEVEGESEEESDGLKSDDTSESSSQGSGGGTSGGKILEDKNIKAVSSKLESAAESQLEEREIWAAPDDFFLEEKGSQSSGDEEDHGRRGRKLARRGGHSRGGRTSTRGRGTFAGRQGGRGAGRGVRNPSVGRGRGEGNGAARESSSSAKRGKGRGGGRGRQQQGERLESSGFVGRISLNDDRTANKRIKFSEED